MKKTRFRRAKRAVVKALVTGFAAFAVLCTGPNLSPSKAEATRVPIHCPSYDQNKLLKDYLSLPKKKRTKEEGEKLLGALECIQKTKGLAPSHELFHSLLKYVSIHEKNALGAMGLIRDLALSKDLSPWMQGNMLLAGLPGGGYDLMGRLGMVILYWKRSASSSGIIDAFTDIAKSYPSRDEFTGRFHPVGKEIPLFRARLLANWGPEKKVQDSLKTLMAGLGDRDKIIRKMAASTLFSLSYGAMHWLDKIPKSEYAGGLMEKYGFTILLVGSDVTGIKQDGKQERAIAKSVLSACMQGGVARRIKANLDDSNELYNFRLLRRVVKAEKLLRK